MVGKYNDFWKDICRKVHYGKANGKSPCVMPDLIGHLKNE